MEGLIGISILTIEVVFFCFICFKVISIFLMLKSEARHLREYGAEEQPQQRCSPEAIQMQGHFLFSLALEAFDYRQQSEAASDDAEKAQYDASYYSVSTEVVDAVLAIHGLDPHPGVIVGGSEDIKGSIVQFSDYAQPRFD